MEKKDQGLRALKEKAIDDPLKLIFILSILIDYE